MRKDGLKQTRMLTPHDIKREIEVLLAKKKTRIVVAIDGRCSSGKTTLALTLSRELICDCIHMDHFFLQEFQRTEERLQEPGGNLDRERFSAEVLTWLGRGEPFSYRPYDCKQQCLSEPIQLAGTKLTIVEGAYALHPQLAHAYDLKLFMDVDKDEQQRRLAKRSPGALELFQIKWIPLEERYFAATDIFARCDVIISPFA